MAVPYLAGSASAKPGTASATLTIPVASAVPLGDAVVVGAMINNAGTSVSSVTDSGGNTYALAAGTADSTEFGSAMFTCLATVAALTGGVSTITVTFSASTTFERNACACGVPGGATAVHNTGLGINAGSTAPAGTASGSSAAGEACVAWETNAFTGGNITWAAGWAQLAGNIVTASNPVSAMAALVTTAAGTVTASGTITSAKWSVAVVTLTLPAAGGGTGSGRAATFIGVSGGGSDYAHWQSANASIGPLDKIGRIYYTTLDASFTAAGGLANSWPSDFTLIISYKTPGTNVASFVGSIPVTRANVIMVFHHEPENDTFTGPGTNAQNYVTLATAQLNLIRSSAAGSNVKTGYVGISSFCIAGQTNDAGQFWPAASLLDYQLIDGYYFGAPGTAGLATHPGFQAWWALVSAGAWAAKPKGMTEFGANHTPSTGGTGTGYANRITCLNNSAAYLQGLSSGGPFFCWLYFWTTGAGNQDTTLDWQFTDGPTIAAWQAIETATIGVISGSPSTGVTVTPSATGAKRGAAAVTARVALSGSAGGAATAGGGAPAFVQRVANATTSGGAAPVLRAGSSAVTTSSGSATLAFTIPSGVQAGDIIAVWCVMGFASITWTAPGSPAWTAQAAVSGTSGSTQLFTRAYTGTEGWTPGTTTVTFTASASHQWGGVILAASGAPDPALSSSGQVNTAGTTVTVAGITTTAASDLLIWLGFAQAASGTSPGTLGVPAGFTAQVTQASSAGTSTSNIGVLMGTATAGAAGATGNKNGTDTISQVNGGLLLGFTAGAVTSLVLTLGAGISTTAGNTLILWARGVAGAYITGITDSRGNTWHLDD